MEVVNTAKWSPSYKNSQPWEIIILAGREDSIICPTITSSGQKFHGQQFSH